MDVQPGHCWRCEKVLPQHKVPCGHCPMAEYCTTTCQAKDKVRHRSVECRIFGPKTCSSCGKSGDRISQCARCYNAWYCSKKCQVSNWQDHKRSCNQLKNDVKPLSIHLAKGNSKLAWNAWFAGSPFYFGNTMAEDFLRLNRNEWSDRDEVQEQLTRDFHILSAGCGDLRNTVLTAASLPDRYQEKLHITLDDFDPFVMARNVLFLFMLVRFADTDYIASSLTTIWYSLHLSKREYDLIKTSLDELIQMNAQQLHDATRGLASVLDEDLRYLRQVWEGWQSLECQRDKKSAINLRRQRKRRFDAVKEGKTLYLKRLRLEDKPWMMEWFDHGLFLPTETLTKTQLPYDNPTQTGRAGSEFASPDIKVPEDLTFVYCIDAGTFPFMVWDCLQVREHTTGSCSSPMVMYHSYVTNLLQKVKSLILQGRLRVKIFLANSLDFPNHHQTLNMPNYDRIFTSNLADYVGIAKLLQTFKPLLNADNSFSTIVTETMNWLASVRAADIEVLAGRPEFLQCARAYYLDVGRHMDGYNCIREYYNNTSYFIQYLRADIMAGGLGIPALQDVPSFETVKTYHGMQMRDFRKGLNKLVPFMYRVNARTLNMMNGYDRAVEWCLPNSNA